MMHDHSTASNATSIACTSSHNHTGYCSLSWPFVRREAVIKYPNYAQGFLLKAEITQCPKNKPDLSSMGFFLFFVPAYFLLILFMYDNIGVMNDEIKNSGLPLVSAFTVAMSSVLEGSSARI